MISSRSRHPYEELFQETVESDAVFVTGVNLASLLGVFLDTWHSDKARSFLMERVENPASKFLTPASEDQLGEFREASDSVSDQVGFLVVMMSHAESALQFRLRLTLTDGSSREEE